MAGDTHTEHGASIHEEVREVSPGIFAYLQHDGGWGLNNAGFLPGLDAVTLIDTCFTERRTRKLRAAIEERTTQPIHTLINTHHHGDHTYGNAYFPEATVVGHALCRVEMEHAQLSTTALFPGVEWGNISVRPPSVTFEDRLTVYVDALRLELFHVGPAHTRDDIAIWIPERRVLFAGDVAFKDCTPFVLEGSIAHYFDALDRLRTLDAEIVVPGHGPVCGPEVFDETEAYLRFVQEVAREAFAQGLSPLDAALQTDLGSFAGWNDRERIVANIARAYSELRNEPLGTRLNLPEIAMQMLAYNGGRPLTCLA